MTSCNSQELLVLYQAGQSEAATAIFDRYVERLIALARTRIGSQLRRRIDPEDVVQSAYRSFFIHARDGEFEVEGTGDLWRLLARITLNKLHRQVERQTAAKRTTRREEPGHSQAVQWLAASDPTPAEAAEIVEQMRIVTERLSGSQRNALVAHLQGRSVDEISQELQKSPRTVRRLLMEARRQMEVQLESFTDGGSDRNSLLSDVPALDNPLSYSDFVLEKLLGAGGMGKVYRATQRSTGKTVAVKALLKSRQGDTRAIRQFIHEASVLAKLRHPNIVEVLGIGRFPSGGYFIAMEFVDGNDLEARLREGPILASEAVHIVHEVATAIAFAHQAGIVHCDLKPGNTLLDRSGRVVVSDFGFAHLIAGKGHRGVLGGTPGYLPPEVGLLGHAPTPAADIYALGALLKRLTHVERPTSDNKDDANLLRIWRRCLEDDPRDRFPSVEDFLIALPAGGRC